MKTHDESRKEFEAWAMERELSILKHNRLPVRFLDPLVQVAYEAWQQSALLAGKDGERLDWLLNALMEEGQILHQLGWTDGRAAIDAAMKATNQGEAE